MDDAKYRLHILRPGWTKRNEEGLMHSGCTISLLTGPNTIVVDPGSPWDTELILSSLAEHNLRFSDIDYVICTHEHVDHLGSLNQFINATHIIGTSIYKKNPIAHDFGSYIPYEIDSYISVVHTPGHTPHDVSVICRNIYPYGCVVITGDLFECEGDLKDPQIWQQSSWRKPVQESFRRSILQKADLIVPGHGAAFQVNEEIRHLPLVEVNN
ncbi:Metallo-beta-lactamase domain-containing protein 1 [Fasciola hepatica]|uniref:Metallo-beta-lactamase domain-containing protein 1 n=1 Tax=Fasciola hepatica TaxID=6192 RepID=A0A4E0RVN0_FASHE|nr:Metallo-beta-lactamase domain-containing protein 1 [Fasciola hepatica]